LRFVESWPLGDPTLAALASPSTMCWNTLRSSFDHGALRYPTEERTMAKAKNSKKADKKSKKAAKKSKKAAKKSAKKSKKADKKSKKKSKKAGKKSKKK
jgi:hypothetical protein